jgi:dTDP-4-amino-4,6-dideoxygalactose transaminase
MSDDRIPLHRPAIGDEEIAAVTEVLRSGWLTTGSQCQRFEAELAAFVGARHAVAVNSCTAALHLALESAGVGPGDFVLVPTLTFAATAEVVRYGGGIPILIDCDPTTLNMDLGHAAQMVEHLRGGGSVAGVPAGTPVVGIMPVHVGGLMMNVDEIHSLASRYGLWIVEDAAHAFPAAWRRSSTAAWQQCGEGTAAVSCFSFYANKTITTGEGGMATTGDADLAARLRLLSLHGLSDDAWGRYSGKGSWDYRIVAPGYKYNLTDIAAAIGIHQLARAEDMRLAREAAAREYAERLRDVEEIELPVFDADRIHSWHLYPIRLRLEALAIDRDQFIRKLNESDVACSVHWRPLHLHPYYADTFGWQPADLPVASDVWARLVSLPLFSSMRPEEIDTVVKVVRDVCARAARAVASR